MLDGSAGTADLLVVADRRRRRPEVDDEAEVGLVEAHAERRRGDQRLHLVVPQRLLGVLAVGVVEPAGVGADLVPGVAEQRGRLLGRGDGERVDDAAARQVADVRGQPGQPGPVGRQPQHAQPQRVAGERPADRRHLDAAGAELLGDVGDHPLVGGGGGRQHRGAGGQRAQQVADAAVVGPEVVAPVGDAVRLVDDDRPHRATSPGSCSSRNRGLVSRSGETSRTSTSSAFSRAAMSSHSVMLALEISTARMPARAAAATWSRINASSGLTSRVGPLPRRRSSAVETK